MAMPVVRRFEFKEVNILGEIPLCVYQENFAVREICYKKCHIQPARDPDFQRLPGLHLNIALTNSPAMWREVPRSIYPATYSVTLADAVNLFPRRTLIVGCDS